jgi:Flp pilus assembly secretin CpaC
VDIGVVLRFKPKLAGNDRLSIAVLPEISSLRQDDITRDDPSGAPEYARRALKTIVNVRNGEPFVLAGMIQEQDRIDIDKVPLLGDLPLVGKLFRRRDVDKERTEIYIIVIPEILDT